MNWLYLTLATAFMWGVYGILIHLSQTQMRDLETGRYQAFLCVGIAYFFVAILAPFLFLYCKGVSPLQMTPKGLGWGILAGAAGALGAFCVLLALAANQGAPSVVMAIVFAGTPVVNALFGFFFFPPEGGVAGIRWQFWVGIFLATIGGCMVFLFKPAPAHPLKEEQVEEKQPVETREK